MKNILIIAIIIFSTACSSKKSETEKTTPIASTNQVLLNDSQMKSAGIELGNLQQMEIASILKVNGKIDVPPQNMISISVPLGGYLKSTKLLPGQPIRKGESIAIVEGEQYIQLQQDYLTAKEKVRFLENEYLRQKELNKSQASSDKVFQQAETDYKSQQVLIGALNEKLQLVGINTTNLTPNTISRSINIIAPINGYVSKVNVNIGKYVSPTDVLFELINPTDIHLALKIFEKDIAQLFIGQKLFAFTNNQPNKKHPCEILLIGKDISTERSIDVHCHFEDYDKTLVPGTYMNAEIQTKNSKSYVLPNDAIVRFDNKEYAFTQEKVNEFKMVELVTGTTEKGFTEIQNSEKLISRKFVLKGAYSLLMSLKNKTEE
jgi:cobalt-zinc-cadmium efflux system membrane fusion protein